MVAKSKKAPIKSELLFKVGKDTPKWYSIELSPTKSSNEKYSQQQSEEIYRQECQLYEQLHQQDQSSDYQWLQTSLSTTSKDRLAALVTLIRRSPIHSIKQLENLVQLLQTNIQHRRDALTISEVLEDLFVNVYLPENRRLNPFNQSANSKQTAILMIFEHLLKKLYSSFLDLIQVSFSFVSSVRIVFVFSK